MTQSERQAREEERRFLAGYDASEFPHPSVAVDVAIVTVEDGVLRALLVRRDEHPFKGRWSLPGGFLGIRESLDGAAARVLEEKAGIGDVFLEQLYTFGHPGRDPRTRVVSVAYYALVHPQELRRACGTGDGIRMAELRVSWPGERGGPASAHDEAGPLSLAFDHGEILGMVVLRLRGKLDYADVGFELLPPTFTLRDLQEVHESILGRRLNKDSFRRRMLSTDRLAPTGERESGVAHRPAALYRFKRRRSV